MKTLLRILFVSIMAIAPGLGRAATADIIKVHEDYHGKLDRKKVLLRLRELRDVDYSRLSADEKKKIRTEVLGYKKQILKENPVIFISSVGVLILVLCFIILSATKVFD